MLTFSHRLQQEMKNRHLSARDVARRLGVSHTTVNRWLKGVDAPQSKHIIPLSNIFLVNPVVFLSLLTERKGG
jgi:transcriptional regulator with XRE-family HTH domain